MTEIATFDSVEAELRKLSSQSQAEAKVLWEGLKESLSGLASKGVKLHLHWGLGETQVQDFPMMLYHSRLGQCVVGGLEEFETKLAEGWDVHSSLKEAPQAQAQKSPSPVVPSESPSSKELS